MARTAKQLVREQDAAHRETIAQALELAEQHRWAERYRLGTVDTMATRAHVERLVVNGDESRVAAAQEAIAAIDAHVAWIRSVLRVKPTLPSKGYFFWPEPKPLWMRDDEIVSTK